MKKHNFIGKVTFEENVNSVKSAIHPKALVIDIPNPLSSYYSRFTNIKKPNSIVLVTKEMNSFESILRATKNVNTKNNLSLEAAKCVVNIGNLSHAGIRLKGVNRYTEIDNIIGHYTNEGFNFSTGQRINNEQRAVIRVNRFYNLTEINDKILQSTTNPDIYYFRLNQPISWTAFKEKTKYVKHNVNGSGYDIAKAILYNDGEISDIVRVIKPNISLDLVNEIEAKYNN